MTITPFHTCTSHFHLFTQITNGYILVRHVSDMNINEFESKIIHKKLKSV